MRHSTRSAWLSGSAALVLLIGGCASVTMQSRARSGSRAELASSAVRDPVIRDIPKPAGFQLVSDRSLFWQRGRLRIGKCEYAGSTDATTVKRFYEQYMPSAGFTLREMSLENGVYKLRFESEREVCVIRIARERGRTRVLLEIAPQSRGTAEPPKPAAPLRRPN